MQYQFDYLNRLDELIRKAYEVNKDQIIALAEMIADNMMEDHLIFAFGTGHSNMISTELFSRAGGLANIVPIFDPDCMTAYGNLRSGAMERISGISDIIFDKYQPQRGDIMLINSNSGRNAMPIEMAMRCKKEGVKVVAITSMIQTTSAPSRHASGLRLFELADLVIDTCTPFGDVAVTVDDQQAGPCSSIISLSLVNTAICEAIAIMKKKGFRPYVLTSQNIDGNNDDNIRAYLHYRNRIRAQ